MADIAGNNSTHSSIATTTTTITTDPRPRQQRLLQPSPVPYTNNSNHDDGLVSSSGDPSSLTRPMSQPAMATSRNGFGFPPHPPLLLPPPQQLQQQIRYEEDNSQQQFRPIPTPLHTPTPASAPPHPLYPPHYSTPSNDFDDNSSSISKRPTADENSNSNHNDNPDGRGSPSSTATTSKPGVRKRAASIDIREANKHPRLQDLSLYTPATGRSLATPLDVGGGPRDLICLCTKAPKVPRPRNGKPYFLFYSLISCVFKFFPYNPVILYPFALFVVFPSVRPFSVLCQFSDIA